MRKIASLLLAGSALTPVAAQAEEITYWMWDQRQVPVYQQCVDAFQAENPDVAVKIVQEGWDNYWTTLTTAFLSGEGPDVFVNHLSRLPEQIANGMLTDFAPAIAGENVDMGFLPGLAENWSRDGAQFGMPKDWDTVAIFYNKAKLAEAGLAPADLQDLTWNAQDGGSYEDLIARLTVDKAGKRGDEAGFDAGAVDSYGLVLNPVSAFGQTEWSYLAASNGFRYLDAPWATEYHYDDPKLAETFVWLRDLGYAKGFTPTAEQSGKLGGETLFVSGKGAMDVHGSWMINWFIENAPFEVGFAPIPAGPEGRKSMFNGLADSVWSGSPNQDAAWALVKFLGSNACQELVGKSGVVFPARPEGVAAAVATHRENGLDVSAFTDLAKPETTFAFPITDYGSEISTILKGALDQVMLNQGDPAEILKSANEEINDLF